MKNWQEKNVYEVATKLHTSPNYQKYLLTVPETGNGWIILIMQSLLVLARLNDVKLLSSKKIIIQNMLKYYLQIWQTNRQILQAIFRKSYCAELNELAFSNSDIMPQLHIKGRNADLLISPQQTGWQQELTGPQSLPNWAGCPLPVPCFAAVWCSDQSAE